MITPSASADNPKEPKEIALRQLVQAEIKQAGGRLTFARFMELVLYAPELGYYTSRAGLIGARGDFYTAPHLTPVFGQLLARQLIEIWRVMGEPSDFQLIEMGAGQGLLSSDVLSTLYQTKPKLWENLRYTIAEISPALQKGQRLRLKAVPDGEKLLARVEWKALEEFKPESVNGCFFSNELIDAFPVHLIQKAGGEWQEIYLNENFKEELGQLSTPALSKYFGLVGLDAAKYEENYRTEINLNALNWLQTVARILKQGYVLTIDYGYEAESRYHPRRQSGTLQTYNRHVAGSNPYSDLGQQDITSHVDFTALIQTGEAVNLHTAGFTTQALFLAGLGIGDSLRELTSPANARDPKEVLQEYNALQTLINPTKMGNFRVLIQSKNLPVSASPEPLSGLSFSL